LIVAEKISKEIASKIISLQIFATEQEGQCLGESDQSVSVIASFLEEDNEGEKVDGNRSGCFCSGAEMAIGWMPRSSFAFLQ